MPLLLLPLLPCMKMSRPAAESCCCAMQASKLRRASVSASSLEEQRPQKASRRDYSDFAFVTFFATGAMGDNGHTCGALPRSIGVAVCSHARTNGPP